MQPVCQLLQSHDECVNRVAVTRKAIQEHEETNEPPHPHPQHLLKHYWDLPRWDICTIPPSMQTYVGSGFWPRGGIFRDDFATCFELELLFRTDRVNGLFFCIVNSLRGAEAIKNVEETVREKMAQYNSQGENFMIANALVNTVDWLHDKIRNPLSTNDCMIALLVRKRLFIANIGCCRAVISRGSGADAASLQLSSRSSSIQINIVHLQRSKLTKNSCLILGTPGLFYGMSTKLAAQYAEERLKKDHPPAQVAKELVTIAHHRCKWGDITAFVIPVKP